MNKCYQKSVMQTYSNKEQLVKEKTGLINIGQDYVDTGYSICHDNNSEQFKIVKPGIYEINVDAVVSSDTKGGLASIQLFKDGVAVPTAFTQTSVCDANTVAMHFNTKILVNLCPYNDTTVFTLVNTGIELDVKYIAVNVVKLA